MSKSPTTAYTQAVDELAQEQLHAEFPRDVSVSDACAYVTPALFAEWLGVELASQSAHAILGEACELMTDAAVRSLLCALILGYEPRVCAMLTPALVDYVARDLAKQANVAIENFEPSDADLDRMGDPLAAEARSFARKHNASLAAWRVLP